MRIPATEPPLVSGLSLLMKRGEENGGAPLQRRLGGRLWSRSCEI
ncbi:hypothetical protein LINGRAPRIM_LOCUS2594 [Linum grandiflorum]